MESPAEKYMAFEDKVKRTVYLDNISPKVTAHIMKTALGQFGNVNNIEFIPNYKESQNIPNCVLVEMETVDQAKTIIAELTNHPFMILGMPRPVRASAAEEDMFCDRPKKPDRKIQFRWVEPEDPDFEVAKRLEHITKKHQAESSFLLKVQLEKEDKLAKKQAEALNANYRKLEMIEKIHDRGRRLASRYNLNIGDGR